MYFTVVGQWTNNHSVYVYFYSIINNNDALHLLPRAVTHTRHACHHVVVVVTAKVKPALVHGMRER